MKILAYVVRGDDISRAVGDGRHESRAFEPPYAAGGSRSGCSRWRPFLLALYGLFLNLAARRIRNGDGNLSRIIISLRFQIVNVSLPFGMFPSGGRASWGEHLSLQVPRSSTFWK